MARLTQKAIQPKPEGHLAVALTRQFVRIWRYITPQKNGQSFNRAVYGSGDGTVRTDFVFRLIWRAKSDEYPS